jgi:hypothetical protein
MSNALRRAGFGTKNAESTSSSRPTSTSLSGCGGLKPCRGDLHELGDGDPCLGVGIQEPDNELSDVGGKPH